jgi:hypothetical protein
MKYTPRTLNEMRRCLAGYPGGTYVEIHLNPAVEQHCEYVTAITATSMPPSQPQSHWSCGGRAMVTTWDAPPAVSGIEHEPVMNTAP